MDGFLIGVCIIFGIEIIALMFLLLKFGKLFEEHSERHNRLIDGYDF